jgi:hypothetical protein
VIRSEFPTVSWYEPKLHDRIDARAKGGTHLNSEIRKASRQWSTRRCGFGSKQKMIILGILAGHLRQAHLRTAGALGCIQQLFWG